MYQPEMQKIYENKKFSLYTGHGGPRVGLMSFCPDDGKGRAICDTFSVSSVECTVADLTNSRAYAAWEDIGKGHVTPGTKAMIWGRACQHWCACNDERAHRVDYIMTGVVYHPTAGEYPKIKMKAGDYMIIVKGDLRSFVGGQIFSNGYVQEVKTEQTVKYEALKDSVIFVITATPYKGK